MPHRPKPVVVLGLPPLDEEKSNRAKKRERRQAYTAHPQPPFSQSWMKEEFSMSATVNAHAEVSMIKIIHTDVSMIKIIPRDWKYKKEDGNHPK